ncbi:DUF2419 domain containing protein [Trichuris trichiura]|uniref:Queuosine 5'-phosphate N-glycosylase/hydrolase n=1 Tax=Trichuris trichiura TaxID=36087 RepID=A0A077ZMX2_TRITR|nr:DUF2419 domain containing protein [Trichuris trichiura]
MARIARNYKKWDCDYLTNNGILDPECSTWIVAEAARHAELCMHKFDAVADKLVSKFKQGWLRDDPRKPFGLPLHVFNDVELPLRQSLNRWFIVCSMSFSFWRPFLPGIRKYYIKDPHGHSWKGAKALMVCFNDLLRCGCALNAMAWSIMPFSVFRFIIRSRNCAEPPMMEERWNCMREVSTVLLEKFDGEFYNCVLKSESDPLKLLSLVLENFPCYRDHTEYVGHKSYLFHFGEPEEVEMRALANKCLEILTSLVNDRLRSEGSEASLTRMDIDYMIDRDRIESITAKHFGTVYFPKLRSIFY